MLDCVSSSYLKGIHHIANLWGKSPKCIAYYTTHCYNDLNIKQSLVYDTISNSENVCSYASPVSYIIIKVIWILLEYPSDNREEESWEESSIADGTGDAPLWYCSGSDQCCQFVIGEHFSSLYDGSRGKCMLLLPDIQLSSPSTSRFRLKHCFPFSALQSDPGTD